MALAERTRLKYQGGSGVYAFTRERVAEPMRRVIERIRLGPMPADVRRLVRANGMRATWQRTVQWMRQLLSAS